MSKEQDFYNKIQQSNAEEKELIWKKIEPQLVDKIDEVETDGEVLIKKSRPSRSLLIIPIALILIGVAIFLICKFTVKNNINDFRYCILEDYYSWTANETFKFKLLLVYVTEIHAELPTRFIAENRTKQVDYVMTEEEIEIQRITTRKVREYLNDMLDGLVEFEVDEYFTTQPITTENFTHPDDGTERDSALFPESIPEVENIIGIYDSVLSSFSINDFNNELNNSSGMAKAQSGEIHFDHALLYPASLNKVSLKKLIENEEHRIWDSYINTYIHELAHTIEMRVNSYSYHLWIGDAGWKQHLDDKYIQKLYYTGNALMEGKKVGLPYSFWAGQIPIVKYEWTEGGYVTCEKQEVLYGGDTYEVEAVERDGYRFVGWSDGLTEPQRIERNVTSDITIKAIFEKIT